LHTDEAQLAAELSGAFQRRDQDPEAARIHERHVGEVNGDARWIGFEGPVEGGPQSIGGGEVEFPSYPDDGPPRGGTRFERRLHGELPYRTGRRRTGVIDPRV
jgi:hypothetical protein